MPTPVPHTAFAPALTRTSSGPISGVSISPTPRWPGPRNAAPIIVAYASAAAAAASAPLAAWRTVLCIDSRIFG